MQHLTRISQPAPWRGAFQRLWLPGPGIGGLWPDEGAVRGGCGAADSCDELPPKRSGAPFPSRSFGGSAGLVRGSAGGEPLPGDAKEALIGTRRRHGDVHPAHRQPHQRPHLRQPRADPVRGGAASRIARSAFCGSRNRIMAKVERWNRSVLASNRSDEGRAENGCGLYSFHPVRRLSRCAVEVLAQVARGMGPDGQRGHDEPGFGWSFRPAPPGAALTPWRSADAPATGTGGWRSGIRRSAGPPSPARSPPLPHSPRRTGSPPGRTPSRRAGCTRWKATTSEGGAAAGPGRARPARRAPRGAPHPHQYRPLPDRERHAAGSATPGSSRGRSASSACLGAGHR